MNPLCEVCGYLNSNHMHTCPNCKAPKNREPMGFFYKFRIFKRLKELELFNLKLASAVMKAHTEIAALQRSLAKPNESDIDFSIFTKNDVGEPHDKH